MLEIFGKKLYLTVNIKGYEFSRTQEHHLRGTVRAKYNKSAGFPPGTIDFFLNEQN